MNGRIETGQTERRPSVGDLRVGGREIVRERTQRTRRPDQTRQTASTQTGRSQRDTHSCDKWSISKEHTNTIHTPLTIDSTNFCVVVAVWYQSADWYFHFCCNSGLLEDLLQAVHSHARSAHRQMFGVPAGNSTHCQQHVLDYARQCQPTTSFHDCARSLANAPSPTPVQSRGILFQYTSEKRWTFIVLKDFSRLTLLV